MHLSLFTKIYIFLYVHVFSDVTNFIIQKNVYEKVPLFLQDIIMNLISEVSK